jgi:hypothetical protein
VDRRARRGRSGGLLKINGLSRRLVLRDDIDALLVAHRQAGVNRER